MVLPALHVVAALRLVVPLQEQEHQNRNLDNVEEADDVVAVVVLMVVRAAVDSHYSGLVQCCR
jgi:hypothetical protein